VYVLDPLPSIAKLYLQNDAIFLSWNSSWDEYYVEEITTVNVVTKNWTTNNRLKSYYMIGSNSTIIRISVCPQHYVEFNISK